MSANAAPLVNAATATLNRVFFSFMVVSLGVKKQGVKKISCTSL
jgi:hypothetical protein